MGVPPLLGSKLQRPPVCCECSLAPGQGLLTAMVHHYYYYHYYYCCFYCYYCYYHHAMQAKDRVGSSRRMKNPEKLAASKKRPLVARYILGGRVVLTRDPAYVEEYAT